MNEKMPDFTPPEKKENEEHEKPLGYIEGSGGALTPFYSEEERLRLLEEIRDNQG